MRFAPFFEGQLHYHPGSIMTESQIQQHLMSLVLAKDHRPYYLIGLLVTILAHVSYTDTRVFQQVLARLRK